MKYEKPELRNLNINNGANAGDMHCIGDGSSATGCSSNGSSATKTCSEGSSVNHS